MHRLEYPLRYVVLTLASLLLTASMANASAPGYDARYDIHKGPLILGETEVRLQRPSPQRYRYRLHTQVTGIAALFLAGEVVEVSEGWITERGFRPEVYRYRRTGDAKARSAELRFDWTRRQVVNDLGGYPWHMAITTDTKDRLAGHLQLMYDLEHGRTDPVYHIADGGRLKTYAMHIQGRETIQTPLGTFETVKVVRQAQRGDNVTQIWCAPVLHYLAVRIERRDRDNGTVTLVLHTLSGLAPPTALISPNQGENGRASDPPG